MFGFSLILQKWPRALHFNFWVRAQRKTAQNGPKNAFFKYLLISHPKVVNAWNKCPFHNFGGMLAWKSGLSFWIPTLKVAFLGTRIWALLAKIAESAHIQVPKNGGFERRYPKTEATFSRQHSPKMVEWTFVSWVFHFWLRNQQIFKKCTFWTVLSRFSLSTDPKIEM